MNRSVVQAVLWALAGGAVVTVFMLLGPYSQRFGARDMTPSVRSYAAPEQMDDAMTDALRQALDDHGRGTCRILEGLDYHTLLPDYTIHFQGRIQR